MFKGRPILERIFVFGVYVDWFFCRDEGLETAIGDERITIDFCNQINCLANGDRARLRIIHLLERQRAATVLADDQPEHMSNNRLASVAIAEQEQRFFIFCMTQATIAEEFLQ